MSRLRVAVIGVGHHGRNHARVLSHLGDVDLVRVVDLQEARATEVAAANGTRPAFDAREVLDEVDAVTIAVPTESHLEVARPFLERGLGVLIEKPLARTVDEADELIAIAARSGATLAVGHTERFNPAVAAARAIVSAPKFIEVHRLGAFPERSLDIDVVFDLMIHDLDVCLSLVDSEVTGIEAVGVPVLTGRVDIANARLRFASGCIANITASRISKDRVRKIRFFQPSAYVSVDYGAQELEVWRLVQNPYGLPGIQGGKQEVPKGEPLDLELKDFLAAVADRRAPGVTGAEGRRALDLAQRIIDKMNDAVAV